MKNLLIVDDHSIVRLGVANVIKNSFPKVTIEHATNIPDAIEKFNSTNFQLAIIDIKLPGGSTLDLVKQFSKKNSSCKILMFSGLNEAQYGERYIKLNVNGFLSKHKPADEIITAIEKVLEGHIYMSDELKSKVESKKLRKYKNPVEKLSTRELEVLYFILDGYGNLEIADKLKLKNSTVSTYKKRLMEKFDVANVLDLVDKYKFFTKEI
ncbi:response regulator transcription factor [Psychroflexus maritimus]|uniref:Response regulator transcription factor n=1 Tax=Psychroflexus maritimus TaxID=2714865 RepID=A0A967ADB5_9FLAO|nr:response regulator transcription factor [Psychroflexus maritimus]NGZ89620.1 response regulator transcription factor [Psychroflexus maritimus]